MKITVAFLRKFEQLLKAQQGVLTSRDLWTILSPTSKVDFYRQLKKLKAEGLILQVARGFYVGEEFSAESLVMAICPSAYLSLEYVLAYYNLIGTYSSKIIRPIAPMVVSDVQSPVVTVEFKQIDPRLCFSTIVENGIRMATKEKALVDTLYFYQKGTKFYFDIYSDIDLTQLDKQVVWSILEQYKNPRFVKFVKDFLSD